MYAFTFHGVTYEPTMKGPKDGSSEIALAFANESRETARRLGVAGRELAQVTGALAQAIEEGATCEHIRELQEHHQDTTRGFEGLHREWTAQSSAALRVFRDHWGHGENEQG
ncbi:hypothetical protein RCO28_30725 [Streptomyces sp. LHD-70]|uniref:hypothetical protein n=1 Tax=Streptomyces sp. LHD-70 TaxID=3072140 RepID=UPI0028101A90|nr:hypothetical protein [Streptomyces sp. LHD-70]MDQ8706813.1 hypothetical protein [Streptomyces sp. LHD-70]